MLNTAQKHNLPQLQSNKFIAKHLINANEEL